MTTAANTTATAANIDTLGVTVLVGDTVRITSYGFGVKLAEVGQVVTVIGIARTRIKVQFETGEVRNIAAACTAVTRRDGTDGLEGNAPKPVKAATVETALKVGDRINGKRIARIRKVSRLGKIRVYDKKGNILATIRDGKLV